MFQFLLFDNLNFNISMIMTMSMIITGIIIST